MRINDDIQRSKIQGVGAITYLKIKCIGSSLRAIMGIGYILVINIFLGESIKQTQLTTADIYGSMATMATLVPICPLEPVMRTFMPDEPRGYSKACSMR